MATETSKADWELANQIEPMPPKPMGAWSR